MAKTTSKVVLASIRNYERAERESFALAAAAKTEAEREAALGWNEIHAENLDNALAQYHRLVKAERAEVRS